MEPRETPLEIVISIRDEVRATNAHLDALAERVDGTHRRLDVLDGRLDAHERLLMQMERELRRMSSRI